MKSKTIYYCTECGNETPKWMGKCSACNSWNTIAEHVEAASSKSAPRTAARRGAAKAVALDQVEATEEIRFGTGLAELDRVLGGGAVKGSLVLVGGEPGIGKSTLLLQICQHLCKEAVVLYVSGEESGRQIKFRAERLGVAADKLYILAETNMDEVSAAIEDTGPDVLIADSIQTLYTPALDSSPGSVGQVKECTMSLMRMAKDRGMTVFVVGHVNKEGAIAGPKVLEHMVDCVLSFEGERHSSYRLLRCAKNRFGSTNEIGVFEMRDNGLCQVPNPSAMLLSGRPSNVPGTCVACVMEGTRPLLAEIQALVAPTSFNIPRRATDGFDYNRAMLLLAVLEKRGGLRINACDVYLNVIGGLKLDEPAADLPAILAIASSQMNTPVPDGLAAIGEVGLTGEVRAVSSMSQRLSELSRLGFKRCIVPDRDTEASAPGLELIRVNHIRQAILAAL